MFTSVFKSYIPIYCSHQACHSRVAPVQHYLFGNRRGRLVRAVRTETSTLSGNKIFPEYIWTFSKHVSFKVYPNRLFNESKFDKCIDIYLFVLIKVDQF